MGKRKKCEKKYLQVLLEDIQKSKGNGRKNSVPAALKKCKPPWVLPYDSLDVSHFSYTCLLKEIRKLILRHNWDILPQFLMFLYGGSVKFDYVKWQSSFLALCNHPRSNPELLKRFIEMCIGVQCDNISLQPALGLKKCNIKSKRGRKKSVNGRNSI